MAAATRPIMREGIARIIIQATQKIMIILKGKVDASPDPIKATHNTVRGIPVAAEDPTTRETTHPMAVAEDPTIREITQPMAAASRADGNNTADNDMQSSVTDEPVETSKTMTEDQFKAKLSPAAKADFDKLSQNGKDKAVKMASHDCKGKNDCKGQNACKTDKNDCAGKGGCKGQSKCAATPDQAVKAASMQDKRASMNARNTNSPRG